MSNEYDYDVYELYEYVILTDKNQIPYLHPVKTIKCLNDSFEISEIIDLFVEEYKLNEMDNERQYAVAMNFGTVPKGICLISMGDYKSTDICMRTIGEFLLLTGAAKFLILHNHPDSTEEPSGADVTVSALFQQIADLLGIEFLGSFIINRYSWYDIKNMESHNLEDLEYNEKIGW